MLLITVRGLHIALPVTPLLIGLCVAGLTAPGTFWRLRKSWPVSEPEAAAQVIFDLLALAWLLYFSGGAANPFITLLLVPIALTAATLSVRAILAVSMLAGVAYVVLLGWYVPLPMPEHAFGPSGFTLHVAGMGVNFVISAVLLAFFTNRLARAVRLQQVEMQRVRERALRDEGILAIATQAAGAAHELNTPLATMRTLLPELRREHASDTALGEDLALLEGQVERCRTILREMVAFGKAQLSQVPECTTLDGFIHGALERFQLLRPEADLELQMDDDAGEIVLRTPPGLRHALLNLLNNAFEASSLNQSQAVDLIAHREGDWLEFVVRDHGPGFVPTGAPAALGQSHKLTGLGIGLALAEATAERLNGELIARNAEQGAEVCLRLPLAVIAEK